MSKDDKIMMILRKKIEIMDPWYAEICKLKELPINVQKLAINISCKNTVKAWYLSLENKKKYLLQSDTWLILKNQLSTITKKKIKLTIEKKNTLNNILTPYELFKKIYQERISQEYSLLVKDPNIKNLKKFFNVDFQKKHIKLV